MIPASLMVVVQKEVRVMTKNIVRSEYSQKKNYYRVDYYSRRVGAYTYKLIEAKSAEEAVRKSRIKNIEEVTLVAHIDTTPIMYAKEDITNMSKTRIIKKGAEIRITSEDDNTHVSVEETQNFERIGYVPKELVRKEDRYTLHFKIAPDGNGTIFYNQTPQQVKTLEEEYSKNFRVKCVREERKDNKVEKDYMLYDKE